jgi:hypothetical protein
MRKMINSKTILGSFILFSITLLIISSPASAFIANIISNELIVDKGKVATFDLTLNIEEDDNIEDIDHLEFNLDKTQSSTKYSCSFDIDANILEGCSGITIERTDDSDDGYCFGYPGECDINYKIILDTNEYDAGDYESLFIIVTNEDKKISDSGEFTIIEPDNSMCSIRAKKGNLIVNGIEFKNSKINFYIPYKQASEGQGYLYGQDSRTRFSYRFDVDKILENNDNQIRATVSGTYRLGPKIKTSETATLTFNKITQQITLVGPTIQYSDGDIYFKDGCKKNKKS